MRRLLVALLLLALPGCAKFQPAACGGPDDPGAGRNVSVPKEIGGLQVELEKSATKRLNNEADPAATYQCPGSGRVYAMRKKKELRGVLQISRLAPDARLDDIDFLRGLLNGPTGNVLQPVEINCVDVYRAVGANDKLVIMWFVERWMFFLTLRESQTLPGVPVGVDFDRVVQEVVLIGPPDRARPEPGTCATPKLIDPSTLPSTAPTGSAPPTGGTPVGSPAATPTTPTTIAPSGQGSPEASVVLTPVTSPQE